MCKQYYQQKNMVFQSTKVHCLIWIMYVKPLKSVNFIGRRITLARVNRNWRLNQYTYIFKELLNPPHSVLKRPHIHTARLHDLSKFGFLSYTWKEARYQLCIRINKLDQLGWQARAYSTPHILIVVILSSVWSIQQGPIIHKTPSIMKLTEENKENLQSNSKWDAHMSSKNYEKNGFSLNLDSICLPSLIMCLAS